MKKQIIFILIITLNLTSHNLIADTLNQKIPSVRLNSFKNTTYTSYTNLSLTIRDSIPKIQMGTLNLSNDFIPLLFVERNVGINLFKFTVPFDGNIVLNGFVSAGTNNQMLYSRLIKNDEIISQKTCGIGTPLRNGPFNYQVLVNAGDKLYIQIIVIDTNWQLHCCPDLYSCTYILSRN